MPTNAFSWSDWQDRRTLVTQADKLPQSLVRCGILIGLCVLTNFNGKRTENMADHIRESTCHPGLEVDTLCLVAAINDKGEETCAGACAQVKKARIQALGVALAFATVTTKTCSKNVRKSISKFSGLNPDVLKDFVRVLSLRINAVTPSTVLASLQRCLRERYF